MALQKPEVQTEVKIKTGTATKVALITAIVAGVMTAIAFVLSLLNV